MRLRAVIALIVLAGNLQANVVDVAPERGRAVASINWSDETGRARQLSEFSGYPLVLLPIYTRCQTACVSNVDRLETALATSSADPRQFRVLLFSFDSGDTPATLTKYRERKQIPLAWSIGAASQTNIDALLESLGVQVGKAGAEFTHPNIVVFLDPKLRIAKWIYGTGYGSGDVDLALEIAAGRSDWIGQHSQAVYAVLLFAGSILCVALCYYLLQFASRRRSGCGGTGNHSIMTADR
jgi:protein SCO1